MVDRNVEVDVAHPGENRLANFVISPKMERRILINEPMQTEPDLVFLRLRFGDDRHLDRGRRERRRDESRVIATVG